MILFQVAALAGLAVFAAAGPAAAQPRPFNCVGAERLEDDVFAVPFARGAAAPAAAALPALEAAAALAKAEPERRLCVLGFAGAGEGGAQAGTQLAARRAGAVAQALARLGVERDRIRAEARRANFARPAAGAGGAGSRAVQQDRSVAVVVLP